MSPCPQVLRFLVVAVAGWINQQQRDVIDSLQEENRGAQTARPVLPVLGIAPAGALLRQHLGGGLFDRGHACSGAVGFRTRAQ